MSISSKSINNKSKLSRHIQAALFGGVALNAGGASFGVEALDMCQIMPTLEQCNKAPELTLDSTDSFGNSTVLFDRQSPVSIGKNANVEDEGKIQRVKIAIQSPSNGENEFLEYDTSKLDDLLSTNASSSEVVTKHAIEVISLDASPSSIETFIKSIKYFNSVAWPTGTSRTINVEVEDDRGSKASRNTIIDLQAGLEFDDYFTVTASSVVNGDKFLVNADLFQAADGSGVNLDEFNIGIYDRRSGLGVSERFDNTGYGAFYLDSNKDGELTEDELLSNNNNSLNIKLSELNDQHVYFLHSGSEPAQDFQLAVLLSGQTPAGSESKVIKLPVSVIEADQPPQIISSSPKASQIELSLTSEMQAATERVIQIDPAGIPHVVYFEEETKKLIWSRYNNGAWVEIHSDLIEFSWDTRVVPKLKFHSDGTAYVSYRNVDMYESPTIHLWRLKQTSSSVEHIILTEHDNPLVPSSGNDIFVSGVGPTYEGYDFVIDKNGALLVLAFDGNNTSKYNLYKLDGSGSQLSWARQEGFELPLLGREMGHYFVISNLSLVYSQNSDSLFYTAQESPPGSPSISAIGQFSSSETYTNDYFNTDLGGLKTDSNYSYFSQLAQHIGNDDTPAGMHSLIAKRSHNSENSETEIYYQYVSNDESKKVVTGPITLPNDGGIHQVTLGKQQVLFVDLEQVGEVSKVVVNRLVDEKWKSIYEYNLPFVAAKEFEVVTTPDGGLIVLTQDAQDNSVVHTSSIAGLADIELMEAISANSPQKPFEKIKLHDSDTELLSFVVSTEDLAVPGLYTLPDGFNQGAAEIEFTENGKGLSIKGPVEDINRILAALIFTPNADYQGTPTYIYTVQELPGGATISGSLNIDIQSLVGLESLITASTLNIKEDDKMRLTEDLFQFDAINADVVEDFRFTLDAGSLGPVAVYYDYDGNGELLESEKLTGTQLNQPWQYSDMQNSHYYFVHDGSESPLDFPVTINMSLIEDSNFKSSHKLSGTLTLPVKVELVDDAPVIGQKGQIGATEVPLTDEMLSASELVVEESAKGEIFAAYFNQASQQVTIKKFVDKQWQQVDIINTLGAHSSTSLQMRFDNNGSLYLAFISKAEANSADGAINKSALSVAKYNTSSGARDYHYQSLQDVILLSDVFGFALDEHGLPYVMVPNTLSESNVVTEASIFKLNDNSTPAKWQTVYAFSDKLFDDFRYSDEGQLHPAELKSLSLTIDNGTIHYAAAAQMNMASATLVGKIVEDQGGLIHIIHNELGGKVKTADGESYMSSSAYISQAKAVNSVSGVHSLTSLTEFWEYTYVDYFAQAYDGSDTYQVDRLKISNHGSVVALGSDTAYAAEVTSEWGSSTTRVVVYHVVDKTWEIYHEFELPFGSDPTSGELKFSGDNQLFYTVKDSTEQLSRLYKIGDVGAIDWSASEISANIPSNILAGLQIQDPDSEEAVFTLTTDGANLPGTFSLPADFDKGAAIVEFTQNGKGVRLSGPIKDINRVLAALIFTPNSQYEGTPKYTYTVQGSSGGTETNGEFDLNIISYTELSSFFTLAPMNVLEGGKERIRVNLFPSIDYQGDIWDDLTFLFDTQSLHSGDIYHDVNGDGTIVDSEKLTEQELSTPRPLADILNGAFYFAHDGSESPLDFSILVDASLQEGSEHSQRYSSSATFTLPVTVELVDDPIEFGAQSSNITTSEIPLTGVMLNAEDLLIKTSPSGEIHVIYTEDVQTATKLSWRKLVDGEWQNVIDDQFGGRLSSEFQSISPQLEFADDGSAYLVHIQHGSNDEKSLSMIHYDAESGTSKTYPLSVGAVEGEQQGDLLASQTYALTLDENGTPYVMFHRDNLEWSNHVIYKFQQNGDELDWAEYRDIEGDLHYIYDPVDSMPLYLPIKSLSLVVDAQSDVAYYSANMSGDKYYSDQALTQGDANSLQWNRAIVFKDNGSSLDTLNGLGGSTWNVGQNMSDSITSIHVEQKKDALGNIVGLHSLVETVSTGSENTRIIGYNYQLDDGSDPIKLDPITLSRDNSNFVLGKETPYVVEVTPTDNGGSNVVIQHVVDGQWEVYQQYEVPFLVNKAPELEISGTNQLVVSVEGDNAGETYVAITKDEPTNWAMTPINAAKPAQFFKDFVVKDDDADEVTFSVNTNVDGLPGVFSLPEDFDPGTASIDFGDPNSADYGKEVRITGTIEDVNRLIAALTFTPKDGYEGKPQYSYSLQSNTDDEPLTSNFDLNITDANTAPTRVVNKPIYVLPEHEGHTQITIERLKATDPDDNDAGIFYEIVELPESGLLRLTHSDGGSGLVETDLHVGGSFSQLDLMDNEAGTKLEYIVENGIRAGAFKLQLIDGGEDGVQPSESFIVSLVDTKPAVSLSQTDINLSALLYENAFTTIEAPEFDAQSVTFGLYEVIDGICTTDVFAGIYLDGNALKADDLFDAGDLEICVVAKDDIWEVKQVFTLNLEDNLPVEAPSMPDLISTWDKGVSDDDNITNSHFLQFTGSAEPNTRVTLISDIDGELGSIYVGADGKWIIATNAVETNDSHEITAVAQKGNITSLASAPLVLIFDNIVPPYLDGNFTQMSKDSQSLANTNHVSRVSKPTYIGVAQGFDFVSVYITAEDGSTKSFNEISVSENGSWTFTCPEELPDGSYTITFNGLDHAGNQTSLSSRMLYVDTDANDTPTIFNWLGEDGYINASELNTYQISGSSSHTFSSEDRLLATVQIGQKSFEQSGMFNSPNWSIDQFGLNSTQFTNETEFKLTLQAADIHGNTSEHVVRTAKLDVLSPSVVIETSQSLAGANEPVRLLFSFSEPVASFTRDMISLQSNKGTLGPVVKHSSTSYSAIYTPAAGHTGQEEFKINAGHYFDIAGNQGQSASFKLDIDSVANENHSISFEKQTYLADDNEVKFTLLGLEAGSSYSYELRSSGGGVISNAGVLASNETTKTVTVSQLDELKDGELTLSVVATDKAGNRSAAKTTTATMDRTAPSVVSITANDTRLAVDDKAIITITLSEPSADFNISSLNASGGRLSRFKNLSDTVYQVEFTPSRSVEQTGSVSVNANSFTDIAGNGNTLTSPIEFDIDTKAPGRPSVTLNSGVYNAESLINAFFTVSYEGDADGFEWTLSNLEDRISGGYDERPSSSGPTYLKETLGMFADSDDFYDLSDGIYTFTFILSDDFGNDSYEAVETITLDNQKPTVNITVADGVLGTEGRVVEFTVSESVTGFDLEDISASSGHFEAFTSHGNNRYTAKYIPLNDVSVDVSVSVASGAFTDAALNAVDSTTKTLTVDTKAPSVQSVNLSSGTYNIQNQAQAGFSFVGAEVGATYRYTLISSGGGTISESGTIEQANQKVTFTDFASLKDGDLTLNVALTDIAGNTTTVETVTGRLDSVAPSVTVFSTPNTKLKQGDTALISITLNEASDDFTETDLTVEGGSLSDFKAIGSSNTQYQVTFTPTQDSEGSGRIALNAGVFNDVAGNANTSAQSIDFTLDSKAPSGYSVVLDQDVYNMSSQAIRFNFSGAEVGATYAYTLTGSGHALSGTGTIDKANEQVAINDISGFNDGPLSLSVELTDSAGNKGVQVTDAAVLDKTAITGHSVSLSSDIYNATTMSDLSFTLNGVEAGGKYTYTLTSSGGEQVNGSGDITSSSQLVAISDLSSIKDGQLTLSVSVEDSAGNVSTVLEKQFELDSAVPLVSKLEASDVSLSAGETSVITITLSEASNDFAQQSVTATGGTLSNFEKVNDSTYRVVFTPNQNSEEAGNIVVEAGKFTDLVGNANNASSPLALNIDTKLPSGHSVKFDDTVYNASEVSSASITITGAEVGTTYHYVINSAQGGTPISVEGEVTSATQKIKDINLQNLLDGQLNVTLTLKDQAGNTSGVASHTATLDTALPEVVSLTSNDMELKQGEEALLTITLSEAVEAFSSAQFGVVNGKLSDFKALSPTTYQAKLKPSDNVDGEIQLVISAGSIQDAAGNTNSEAKSLSIMVDTSVPTGQSVTIDQAEINEDNDTALSFTLRGLEGSGLITYHISDGSNSVGSTSPIAITGTTQVISGIDVSSLAEGKLFLNVVVLDDAYNAAEAITATVNKAYNVAPTLSGTPASTINEDSEFVFEPLLNDPDTDNEHVFTINQTLPWATFDAKTGKLNGTPTDEHVGIYDNIQITVNDGRETFTLPAFSVEVVNTNDAPVAQNLAFDLNEAEQLIVAKAQGLIDTATDDDIDSGDVLKAIIVNEPQFGALVLNDDGSFTYSHDGSENHSDSFGYQIEDASGARSELRTVSLNMNAQADAPVTADDFAQTFEDTQIIVNLLTNDSDAENDMVASSAAVIVEPKLGSYSIENGIVTYTPNLNATGQDSLTYTVKDLAGNTSAAATLIIDITPVNDKPVAKSFELLVTEDTASDSIDLRSKSEDVEDVNPTGAIALTATPTKGVVTLDQQTGSLVYTPNADAIGSDAFSYTIADSDGLISEPAIVTVNIGAVNDRPVVDNDTLVMTEDEVATLNILANDSDVEDQGFNAANVMLEDKGAGAGVYDMADVAVLADGTLEITPKQDANGRFSFTYTLVDSEQLSSESATVTVDITPVNDAPVALDNMAELFEEGSHEVNVLGNDSDVDENDNLDLSSVSVVKQPLNGQVRVTDTGAIVYVPNTNFNGDDTFTYTVRDAAGALSNEATVTMTVKPLNDAPVAQSQSVSLAEDGSLLITLAATDIDGDELSYQIVSSTASGSLTQLSVNTWTYAPNANFNGQDSLQFIAFDGQVESAPAQVTITVDAANDAPEISGAPATSVDQDVAYSFTPQATDLDEDSLTFSVSNLPVWASFDAQSGTLSGTPGRDDVGSYTDIVITVSDGELTASLSPFAIEVGYVNAKPVAQGMDVFVNEDSTVSFSAPVSDADQDSLSISITEQPSFGSLTVQGQLFTYVPGANFNGSDSFSYVVNDGAEDSVSAQVAISVNPLNDAPVAQNDAFTFNTVLPSYTLDVLTNDTDVDAGDVLSLVGASASIGSVTIENGQLVYQPQATVQDTAVITYMIADPQGEQSSATATVDIVNNAAGSAGQLTLTTPQDKVVDATGLFTKVDLGSATATDGNGNPIAVSLVDGKTVFAPGLHHVYWKATDSNEQSIVKKQTLTVNPLISLSKDSQIAEEHTHTVKVFLNGEAPSYPVTVPYTISGTADGNDHDLIDGEVIINEGNEGVISFNVFGDGVVEGNETIVITLADTLNRGAKFASTVTIVEENVAPALSFETVQSGESRSLIVQSGGLVQVKASATDANPLDSVTYSWLAEDQQLGNLSTAADVFELDPKGLSAGIYKLSLTASDDGVPSLSSTVDVYLEVVESLPELGTEDSDGDLIPDSQEGFADTDNDGIPDYLDANSDCNVIPGQIKDPNQFLVEGEPGVCLRKGVTVAQNSTGGAQLLESELPADAEATNIGGLFDFIATGLPKEGDVYGIVIPQRKPIPVNAIYRKYRNGEWINFAVTDQDKILSAAGEPGYCPPPGSSEWRDGLNEGDWCVQLKIVDGGPNDDDGIANRSIVDPGGIAVLASDNTLPLAQADSLVIGVSEPVFIDVLNNDTDADGDILTITGASVDFGEVEVIDNQLKYTPPMNFVGTASITYSIADGKGGTASSTVTIELVVNNAPVTAPDSANTTDKSSLIIDVLSNDTDPDGDVLTLVSAQANHGKATINSDGTLSYEPLLGFTGEDVVTYVVKDDKGATSEGIVKVSVTAHQSVSAQNSSSGSLGGLLVVMISALVIRRRSSKLPAYALITTACVMSSSAAAQQWRIQGTLGQAEARADFSALPTSTQITNIDDSSQSLSVGAFFQLMPSWNIGMRYIDLGQGRVNFSDSTVNPDSWQKTVSRVAPVLPEGFALQTGLEVFKHNKLHAELFLGAYGWDYSIESKTNTRSYTEYEQKGTSAYIGSAIGYELTDNVSAVLTYSYYRLSANRISEVAAGVEVRF
ncbi:tandem-95 repeat protein [Pseudoalteromonas luteoviolacea]|uniref:tandem-95 repeat protein n=1 Tax=Pseudoalteromonas luteoviolacea TaxID=43657 RepID=UPI001B38EA8D|nr:tandem-95 repeat protein [Pseudoalteromonas luteoviolacea]MBQ4875794.1 tandem-95 repeat protein [Pseudoalteromonas luteoviolacea]MBQ4904829.1 tandem-95 repeat protein [Pseudoalteromonas luteoviolacea]